MPTPNTPRSPEFVPDDDDFDIAGMPVSRANLLRHLPPAIQELGATLVEQELWCIGGDVRHRPENLLLEYGFSRERVPSGSVGSTAYRMRSNDAELVMWGWGVAYAESGVGAIFIRRLEFDPLLLATDAIPETNHPHGLEPLLIRGENGLSRQGGLRLIEGLCQKLAAYETWLSETLGVTYREERINSRPTNGATVPAEVMAEGWRLLGREVAAQRLLESSDRLGDWWES